MNLNKVLLAGRLTGDVQLRTTPSGQPVATFSIATNRTYTDKSGAKKEETEFHNIVAWGRQAEVAQQYMVKGQVIFVEGRLQTRSWNDKQGQAHKTTEIICDRFQFGQKPAGVAGNPTRTYNAPASSPARAGNSNNAQASPAEAPQTAPEDIPIINVDEDTITAEDLPF
jgi:single-strand DNA-binding protein